MRLITGKLGEAHVTSVQHRNIIRGLAGNDSYIAKVWDQLLPSISGNVLSIRSGMLIHHGCAMQVDNGTTDTVQLTAGTAGYYRGDYVVARWTQDASTGIEAVEWVLIQGTPTTNRAVTWPTYNTGNMQLGAVIDDCPVFQIYYDGVTPSVTRALPIMPQVNDISDLDERLNNALVTIVWTATGMSATLTPGDNTLTLGGDIPSGGFESETYKLLGIIGVQTSGTGSASCRLRAFGASSNGYQAYVKIRNESNADIQPTISVTTLWAKSSLVR